MEKRMKYAGSYLRLELSIEFFISFRESVSDLNSNELRSPPSAKHCSRKHIPVRSESVVINAESGCVQIWGSGAETHPDLQQESSETGNELRERRVLDALFSVRQSVG